MDVYAICDRKMFAARLYSVVRTSPFFPREWPYGIPLRHVRVFASSLVDVADKMNEAGQLADQLSSKAEASEKLKSVAEGVSIARDFLVRSVLLQKYQIESFSVDKGEKFDVARHEISPESAIKEVKKGEEAIVDGVVRNGWKMESDVLRKARVNLIEKK